MVANVISVTLAIRIFSSYSTYSVAIWIIFNTIWTSQNISSSYVSITIVWISKWCVNGIANSIAKWIIAWSIISIDSAVNSILKSVSFICCWVDWMLDSSLNSVTVFGSNNWTSWIWILHNHIRMWWVICVSALVVWHFFFNI